MADPNAVVVDIATGKTLAKLASTGTIIDTPDGCTAVTVVDQTADVVLNGTLKTFDGYTQLRAVAPDLTRVVAVASKTKTAALIDVATGQSVSVPLRAAYEFVDLSTS